MFDVIWTDPDRELVGEHRVKKEIAREQQRAREKAEGLQSSLSTRGSSSSSERPFGFFGSRSLKKAVAPLKSRPSSNPSPLLESEAVVRHSARDSLKESSYKNTESPLDLGEERKPSSARLTEGCLRDGHISFSSSRDSALSKCTDKTAPSTLSPSLTSFSESTKSSTYQALSSSSFIANSTEATASRQTLEANSCLFLPETLVDWDEAMDILNLAQSQDEEASADEPDFPISLFPRQNSSSCPSSPEWASDFKPNNPSAWKAPSAWKRPPTTTGTDGAGADQRAKEEEESNSARIPHLRRIERELELMAAADTAAIVSKLGETWGNTKDVGSYKEIEMGKKRWMLSALQTMDQIIGTDTLSPARTQLPEGIPRKVLALHESQATASYLAASHSSEQVYHLSPSPLSPELFPNIHPVKVPTVSALNLPVPAGTFSAVHSLSLPSLISSQDIPHLLKRIHCYLLPGGTLHLTLVDPMPVTSSLGPVMRAWLEKHLLLNLEKNFRCVNPNKLFPHWLAECYLHGEDSVISTAKFAAIPPGSGGIRMAPDGRSDDRKAKAELRGVVGRMLWTEVWGMYVGAERWWWEEPACVKECLQMGTHWEYHLIEAVKEG